MKDRSRNKYSEEWKPKILKADDTNIANSSSLEKMNSQKSAKPQDPKKSRRQADMTAQCEARAKAATRAAQRNLTGQFKTRFLNSLDGAQTF